MATFQVLVAVAGGLAVLVKPVTAGWKLARRTARFLDVWEGTDETPGIPERIAAVETSTQQLQHNGGGSVKDAVTRIDQRLEQHLDECRRPAGWRRTAGRP
jgi:hypothetical protein